MTTNEMIVRKNQIPTVQNNLQEVEVEPAKGYLPYNGEQIGKFVEELVAAAKDDRLNTKHALSADTASAARVQNQNDKLIDACSRELRRRDLPEERRDELLCMMKEATDSSARESERSREFQREQLEHSHGLPLKIAAFIITLAVGGVGGTALIRAIR